MIRGHSPYASVAIFANPVGMVPVEIKARLERTGRTQASLGEFLGKKKDSISRLLNGERAMTVEEAKQIDLFFSIDAALEPRFKQIDVYGYAAAGGDGSVAIASDRVLDHIEVPVGISQGEVIAIRVAGDSMEPRLYSGEIVIVSVGVPPKKFSDCVVEFMDGTAIVKQYRGRKDGYVLLWQYNPELELKIPALKIRNIHAVAYRK